MPGTVNAVLIIRVHDRFSIAVGVELVAEFFEFFAEFEIVVDLAVENNPGSPFLVVDGLFTTLQIDDRQPAHAQADATINVKAIIVRTAVLDRIAHPGQQLLVDSFTVISN